MFFLSRFLQPTEGARGGAPPHALPPGLFTGALRKKRGKGTRLLKTEGEGRLASKPASTRF